MLEFIRQPWPWYVAGVIIGLTVPYLLLIGNKTFGLSSSLRHVCAACIPAGIPFFKYDWKKEAWSLFFVVGIALGAFIAVHWLSDPAPIRLAASTSERLVAQGITDTSSFMPAAIFSWSSLFTLRGFLFLVVGGFMVGFGTRYGGGCTSGHAIMGLSSLQWPSLVATIMFMLGGIVMTWLILPFLVAL